MWREVRGGERGEGRDGERMRGMERGEKGRNLSGKSNWRSLSLGVLLLDRLIQSSWYPGSKECIC